MYVGTNSKGVSKHYVSILHLTQVSPSYLVLLETAGDGRHADQRVRGDDRDVLVKSHHQGLQLFRHLPRAPERKKGENTRETAVAEPLWWGLSSVSVHHVRMYVEGTKLRSGKDSSAWHCSEIHTRP